MVRSNSAMSIFYQSYEQALMDCQKIGYQNKDIVKVVARKNAVLRDQIESNPAIEFSHLRAITGIALAAHSGEFRVIDFGGGGGNHYTIAKKVLSSAVKLRWSVIETQAMVDAVSFLETEELHFFDDLQVVLNNFENVDLVFSSGALHCCNDPLVFLQDLISVKARYLYITRTSFNDGSETLINIQHSLLSDNGPGLLPSEFVDKQVSYPNVFIPIEQVESALSSEYNIRFKVLEEKDVYRVGNVSINMYGYFCEKKA